MNRKITVIRHPRENLKKCSLRHLHDHPNFEFLAAVDGFSFDATGYTIYATHGTAKFLNDNGVKAIAVCWPDEVGELHIMDMFSQHVFELVVNIPKDHSKRELTNGYKIRRAAIDHNIPLITNARLASAFISAFCQMRMEDIQIKSWQEYK